jgi:TonB family protein
MLSLFSLDRAPETSHELPTDGCANGVPCFTPIPPSHLPAKRMIQGLTAESLLILVGLWLSLTFAPTASHVSTNDVDTKKVVRIYYPRPTQKRPLAAPSPRVKTDESLRFSAPPKSFRAAVAPILEPPPVIAPPAAMAASAIGNGIPVLLRPVPEVTTLPIRAGVPKPLPVLDAGGERDLPRGSSLAGRGPHPAGAPLGFGGTETRTFGHGRGVAGPPDLDTSAPRITDHLRPQSERAAFTKPSISFMPRPSYPRAALENGIEGDVRIEVTFDKDAHVIFKRFVRPLQNADLNSAARESIERIRFVPAMRDGVPIDQDSVVTVYFRLSRLDMTASF